MNNLHRELAPITPAAWAEIEEEATRTFKRNIAGRRVVDVVGPSGLGLAAVGTGHTAGIDSPADGVTARLRTALPVVELRVPFTVTRAAVDDVARGSQDSDWDPVKQAATTIAMAEDRAIFEGYQAAQITGIKQASSHPAAALPADPLAAPAALSEALSTLRLDGVDGPYSVLMDAETYTAVSETSDHGYPVREHLRRIIDGDIIWAPGLDGAVVLTTRGGDFALHIGQDLSIGYHRHDAETIELYLEESFTFVVYSDEAAVALTR